MNNRMKNIKIHRSFNFVAFWGVFQGNLRQLGGVLGLSTGVLEAFWEVLEVSWRCLGGVLGRVGGILDMSWGKLRIKVEGHRLLKGSLGAKMEAKIVD